MDFKQGKMQSFPGNVPLPFYMTYPGYLRREQENEILKDLEYLQQTYPGEVKHYQRRVAEILDKIDYEGSMIYDEYPDRYTIERMAKTVVEVLKREEEQRTDAERKPETDAETNPEKWKWLEHMVQVLICNEIYKRRHGGRRGILKF